MPVVIGLLYEGRILYPHLTAERIVVNGLLDVVVAINYFPCTAQVVGNVVVPAGRQSELLCLQLEKLPLSAEHALEMVSSC